MGTAAVAIGTAAAIPATLVNLAGAARRTPQRGAASAIPRHVAGGRRAQQP